MSLRSKRRRRPELPLVPLIDVLVMLVLFSFVTMRFATAQTLNISVPRVDTAGKNAFTGKVEIGVDKDGNLSLNGRPVEETQLREMLREIQRVNKDTPVIVRADGVTQFQRVTEVWDICRSLGLNKVNMQVRTK